MKLSRNFLAVVEVSHETVWFMILFFIASLFLATSAFCQKLRPVTIGLTGKSLATAAFEMSVRKGHFKQEGLDVNFITLRHSHLIITAILAALFVLHISSSTPLHPPALLF